MTRILKAACVIVTMALATSCRQAVASDEEGVAQPPRNPMEIVITPDIEKGIVTGETPAKAVANSFTVSGKVDVDQSREARVGSPVTGRIADLMAREGDVVKKGQVLATLNSTDLAAAQFAFLKAYSQSQLYQRAVERAQQLLAAGVIGSAELQRREAELSQSLSEISALRGQLRVLGMPEEAAKTLELTRSVNSLSQIVASLDGVVLERKATVGQVVQPADTIFMLADLSHVWLVAEVPEQIAGNLIEGQTAEAEIPSLPGQLLRGRLSYVRSILNPETRTVKVHMDVPNPRGKLKPSMLATMMLRETPNLKRVIPITAVVRENNKEFVFVKNGSNTFVLREVTLGEEHGTMRVLVSGLQPAEKIILDGAFHLNNERKRLALSGAAK